jgi:hypothetical protein
MFTPQKRELPNVDVYFHRTHTIAHPFVNDKILLNMINKPIERRITKVTSIGQP